MYYQSGLNQIDNSSGSLGRYLDGSVDNVRVYNRALTGSEVIKLYVEPFAGVVSSRRIFLSSIGIAFDAASNSGYQAAASSYSWSHTCTGANRYLTVDISMLSLAQTVSSITYNSVALTLIGVKNSISGAARVEQWGLVAPATGSNTIAVTLSGSIASAGTAVSYTGVHQTYPTEGFNSAQATNVGAADASVAITPIADNCWVHAAVASDDTSITANQTSRNNVTGGGGSGADEDTGPISPAAVTTMSYTNIGALATWVIAGYALRPIAAANLASAGGILTTRGWWGDL